MENNIVERINEIDAFISSLKEKREELYARLSRYDCEICDIQHAAEFYNLNAAQGYKLYKLLHDVCVERRACKNELQRIDIILGNISSDSIKKAKKNLRRVDNLTYTPRVLNELFES